MSAAIKRFRDSKAYNTALSRLGKTSTDQVVEWSMSTLWATQQGLEGFRATADRAALDEARLGALSLVAAVDVLLDRLDK